VLHDGVRVRLICRTLAPTAQVAQADSLSMSSYATGTRERWCHRKLIGTDEKIGPAQSQ
jgi:hypothetical protein